ncbi:hypothetical protein [Kutzneria sp. NPDC051319]|uniref:hypothetical protein n=1 Tax=Kutzneria sp. NPDC051319 TaxID=3155047 RepID=UPI0034449E98
MTSLPPADTVARFVLRARRIGAHSLLRDPEALARPADEEVFESLAARVRPLTSKQESTFYPKVLSAIRRLLDAASTSTEQRLGRLGDLRAAWKALKVDDTDATGPVTDSELAAGSSFGERHLAAVNAVSRVAALTMETLRFIEQLRDAGAVTVDGQAWTADVVLARPATVYIAPPNTEISPVSEPYDDLDVPQEPPTRPRMLHSVPAHQLRIELKASDGSSIAVYQATVLDEVVEDNVRTWHLMVDDGVVLHVEMRSEDDGTMEMAAKVLTANEDLRIAHAAGILELKLCRSVVLVFGEPGPDSVGIPLQTPEPDKVLRLRETTELLEDLIELEELTGQEIGQVVRGIPLLDRVRIRQTRLLWAGQVVQWDRALGQLISREGTPPRWAPVEPAVLEVGGLKIPMPALRLGHRDATWHDHGPAPEFGPDTRRFTATLPSGTTRFLAWSPQTRPAEPDAVPPAGDPWGLTGIDEAACPF